MEEWCLLLLRQMLKAFPVDRVPLERSLTRTPGLEAFAEANAFRCKKWIEVDPDTVKQNYLALFWFSDEAFQYYLPAFFLAAFEKPDYFGLTVNAIHNFALMAEFSLDSNEVIKWLTLTDDQLKLVGNLLNEVQSRKNLWIHEDHLRVLKVLDELICVRTLHG
jgi:hypothetical protein